MFSCSAVDTFFYFITKFILKDIFSCDKSLHNGTVMFQEVQGIVNPTILKEGEALRLRAKQGFIDRYDK